MTLIEKKIERRKIWEKMKALNDKALAEKRDLSAEEQAQWTAMETDVDKLGKEVEADEARMLKAKAIEDSFRTTTTEPIKPEPVATEPGDPRNTPEYRKALRDYFVRGEHSQEQRALQVDQDTAGGYLVPQTFVNEMITLMRNKFVIRSLARAFSIPRGSNLMAPTMDSELGDLTFTAELLTGSVDTTKPFGKRLLIPHPMARVAKISKTLVASPAMDVEGIVKESLAYKAGAVEENAFLNGSGSNEPLGVFVAPTGFGITTSRDVSTGNTTTEIKCDGLIEAKYTLDDGYWPNARWIFHRDAVKQIRKLKDGEGQYIWRPGISSDGGDQILDIPVRNSQYTPNTFTTGLYVGILGDFSRYWIADALGTTIQTLAELYALTNENGYIIRKEVDGMPVIEEAFVRVKLA